MENKDTKLKKNEDKLNIKEIVLTLGLGIFLAIIFMQIVRVTDVNGHSMDSTLYNGEKLLLNRMAYVNSEPKYKDIVVVERDDLSVKYIIKRVIGEAGDTIEIKDNQVYKNGKLLNEDYIKEAMVNNEDMKVTVPEGCVFVMGDNRNHSMDSRSSIIGLINDKDIVGKAVFNISDFTTKNL